MSVDYKVLLKEIQDLAGPELEKRANEVRSLFLRQVEDFVSGSRADKLDDLLKRAGEYKVKAVLADNRNHADQYAEAADEVLRQIELLLIAEHIVASREIAAMIQQAALIAWEGFQTVAGGILNFALKTVVSTFLGPGGAALVDGLGGFLGEKLEDLVTGPDQATNNSNPEPAPEA